MAPFRPSREKLLPLSMLIATIAFAAWQHLRYLDERIAIDGCSAIGWMAKLSHPENFLRDFPSCVDSYGTSFFMHIYPLVARLLGAPTEITMRWVVVLEIAMVGAAFSFMAKSIRPRLAPGAQVVLTLFILSSPITRMNLANFGGHYYFGLYYNFAEAARLLAVGLFFRGYLIASALSLALSVVTHPIMGAAGAILLAVTALVMRREIAPRRTVVATGIFLAICAGWFLTHLVPGNVSGGGISPNEWFGVTQMMSYHWYPHLLGYFSDDFDRQLLPLLGLAVLFLSARNNEARNRIDVAIFWGIGALILTATLGVLHSLFPFSPALVKLSLHRCTDLAVEVALVYVVENLWRQASREAPIARRASCVMLLLSPYFLRSGFVGALCVALSLFQLPKWFRAGASRQERMQGGAIVALDLLMLGYMLSSYRGTSPVRSFFGTTDLLIVAIALAAIDVIAAWTKWRADLGKLALIAASVFLAFSWQASDSRPSSTALSDAHDWREAAEWARLNAPREALFLLDPTLPGNSWRDIQMGNSFGQVRDWLYSGWLYNSDVRVYREGVTRVEAFGVKIDDYLGRPKPFEAGLALGQDLAKRFYDLDDRRWQALISKYGIDYLVVRKLKLRPVRGLKTVFENTSFVVLGVQKDNAG